MTSEEIDKILTQLERNHALSMADSPGGGMILPDSKYSEFQELTRDEASALREAWERLDAVGYEGILASVK